MLAVVSGPVGSIAWPESQFGEQAQRGVVVSGYARPHLAKAEVVEQPPEASDEPALREAVEDVVENLPPGSEALDLKHGKALELESGRRIFKPESVMRALREDFPMLRRHELCRVLKDIGFDTGVHSVEGKPVRAWS